MHARQQHREHSAGCGPSGELRGVPPPLQGRQRQVGSLGLQHAGNGRSLTNQAFGRVLHASNTLVTPQGHKYLYTCSPSNTDHSEEFSIVPVKPQDPDDAADELAFTGYFNLTSVRTNMGAAFGEDITPAGRARIH